MADATPYPLPARSRLLQDLGFLACTLPQVESLMPTKKPCGEELTLAQQRMHQALHQRRLRIEHVNSSVKRCRIVKDRIRLWKEASPLWSNGHFYLQENQWVRLKSSKSCQKCVIQAKRLCFQGAIIPDFRPPF